MLPTIEAGDEVIVDPGAYRRRPPRPGEVVLARHPFRADTRIVKRVASTNADGGCTLLGDHAEESTDSRVFGAVPRANILGRVTGRFG